jgi:hypothetical protein
MDNVARAIAYLSAAVSLVLLVQTVHKLLKEAPVSRLAPIVSIGATLLITFVYVVITGTSVNWWLAALLSVLGLLVGFGEGRLTRLYYRGSTLIVKRSVGYLILWGVAYLLAIALDQLGNAALHAAGILIMVFGLGTAVGSNLVLLVRQVTMRPAPVVASPYGPAPPPAGGPPVMYVVQPPPAQRSAYPPPPGMLPGGYPLPLSPPAAYAPPYLPLRRRDSTCFVLSLIGMFVVLCSMLAVVVLIYAGAQ